MAVNLSPVGGVAAQFFDNSGNVLTGGLLYTYLAGTTTPAVTYTSSNGITANSNPIVLDAAGRVPNSGEIWLTDGISYKFILKDSDDVQIASWDNVVGINSNFIAYTGQTETQTATQGQTIFTLATIQYQPATNSLAVYVNGSKQVISLNYQETSPTVVTFIDGLNVGDVVEFNTAESISTTVSSANDVSYIEGGTGSVYRSVTSKLQESISVKDFGAVGDGAVDDTAAIQAGLAYLSNGGTLYFPQGEYLCSTQLTLNSNISLIGVGRTNTGTQYGTTIKFTNASSCGIITALAGGYNHISDMTLVGTGAASGTGLYVVRSAFSVFERLFIREFQYGIVDVAVQHISYNDIVINSVEYGVYWTAGSASDYHTVCTYKSIYVSGASNVGFFLNGGTTTPLCEGNVFISCAADGAPIGWELLNVNDTTLIGCYTELCVTNAYYLSNCRNVKLENCYAGGTATATSSYVALYMSQCQGCWADGFSFDTTAAASTYDMQFLGGASYFNAVTRYYKINAPGGGTANIQSNNVLTSLYNSTAQPQVIVTIANALTMINQGVGGAVGAAGGASPPPSNPALWMTVTINGSAYRIPLYN
jgi:hypothetical protein